MTDNEFMNAMEHHITRFSCRGCFLEKTKECGINCVDVLKFQSLNIITHQKAKIEELELKIRKMRRIIKFFRFHECNECKYVAYVDHYDETIKCDKDGCLIHYLMEEIKE